MEPWSQVGGWVGGSVFFPASWQLWAGWSSAGRKLCYQPFFSRTSVSGSLILSILFFLLSLLFCCALCPTCCCTPRLCLCPYVLSCASLPSGGPTTYIACSKLLYSPYLPLRARCFIACSSFLRLRASEAPLLHSLLYCPVLHSLCGLATSL